MFPRLLLTALFPCISPCGWAADEFSPTPYHFEQAGTSKGKLTKMPVWKSRVFPDTERDWWIYVPAQYDPGRPANLMVFQDGHDYVKLKGNWRVPIVFDNLIQKGELPVTIAVLINPGHNGKSKPSNPWRVSNRSFEYDSMGDFYVRFLLEEIIPEVRKKYVLTDDPKGWGICGASSGGICAFNVAWHRPGRFGKVLSTIGSFTNIRGGNSFPNLIRKTERKPLRIYLLDGTADLDNAHGNWVWGNRKMAAALKYMNYDYQFTSVAGAAHNGKAGGSHFPDAMKWLWREKGDGAGERAAR